MYQKDITEIPLSVLGNLAPMDIEEYLSYLKYYEKDGVDYGIKCDSIITSIGYIPNEELKKNIRMYPMFILWETYDSWEI